MSADAAEIRRPMPRFWLSLGLLAWGVFTDSLTSAFVMAVLLEGITLSPVKWAIRLRDYHRAADLTTVLFAVIAIVQFSRYSVHGIYEILVVAPFCFFPLVLVQRASVQQAIPLSALFYSLRRYPEHDRPLDIAPHFLVLLIISSSTSDQRGYAFVIFATIAVLGLLYTWRARRYSRWQWIAAISIAIALALATQNAVLRSHRALEQSFIYWLSQFSWMSGDPNKAVTAIGAIGRLKLSDQIRVRVKPGPAVRLPMFLQEATYDEFKFGSWKAVDAKFEALDKRAGRDEWQTGAPANTKSERLEIIIGHRRELTVLPVPRGTRRVISPEIAELQQNRFGTVMAESPPGALRYTVSRARPVSIEPPPGGNDLVVPQAYRDVINETLAEVGGPFKSQTATARAIQQFFLDNFKYSLIQRGGFRRRTPLAHFLSETRRGHCEYFASATVLMLRAAAIPARYAVGYVVEDFSELEGMYIARARHAHAWALGYIDGKWQVVDSTPSTWFELENAYASDWQSFQDLAAWIWYRLQRLGQADVSEFEDILLWLVPPLAIILYWRLRRSDTAVRQSDKLQDTDSTDAERPLLLELLQALEQRGYVAEPGETTAAYLRRAAPPALAGVTVSEIVSDYYALRFSNAPGRTERLAQLTANVERYCQALA